MHKTTAIGLMAGFANYFFSNTAALNFLKSETGLIIEPVIRTHPFLLSLFMVCVRNILVHFSWNIIFLSFNMIIFHNIPWTDLDIYTLQKPMSKTFPTVPRKQFSKLVEDFSDFFVCYICNNTPNNVLNSNK